LNIYIDESGDLGFSAKSTKFFVVAFTLVDTPEGARPSIKKLLRKLHKNKLYTGSKLKFSNSSYLTRITVLEDLLDLRWKAELVILEKHKVSPKLRDKTSVLYNYCIVNTVIKNVMLLMEPHERINIYVDRSLSKTNREGFNQYVKDKASWVWQVELEKRPPLSPGQIKISHVNSHNDPCIQLADYISGATFQKYERNNPTFYNLIEQRIISFTYLW